jgi:hypothetical protein
MMRSSLGLSGAILLSFFAGFLSHVLYQRWNPAADVTPGQIGNQDLTFATDSEPAVHRVNFVPFAPTAEVDLAELPLFVARDVEKIRAFTGRQARIRGRVFRVGHSAKSNTYFLNFGPSREALTAVIFASVTELFEKNKLPPKHFENRDVELTGFIKDDPQYGLEVILEHPKQIKVVD